MRARIGLSLLVMLTSSAGCFRLSRETPPLRQYVLSGTAMVPDAPASAPRGGGLALGLRRPEVASYLVTPSIVVRRGDNEVTSSDFHRWGEKLDEAIGRVMGTYLLREGAVRAVDVAPWAVRARHDYLVQLRISRFEGAAAPGATSGQVHLLAWWEILRPLDGRVIARGETDDRQGAFRVGEYGALVSGLDSALARTARAIATCLTGFRNDSTPPATCAPGVRRDGVN